jgi:acyl-CoA thioester hydrolase
MLHLAAWSDGRTRRRVILWAPDRHERSRRMTKAVRSLDAFPLQTYDKLRYADTDRQGHVNNAVFATMLETGRAELLYAPGDVMFDADCAFVIASLRLEFLGEIRWPGRVEIGTRVTRIGNSSFTLDQGLFQDGRCVAIGEAVIVQMNETTRRSQKLHEKLVRRLSELMPSPA